jgi:hypothetical protein
MSAVAKRRAPHPEEQALVAACAAYVCAPRGSARHISAERIALVLRACSRLDDKTRMEIDFGPCGALLDHARHLVKVWPNVLGEGGMSRALFLYFAERVEERAERLGLVLEPARGVV